MGINQQQIFSNKKTKQKTKSRKINTQQIEPNRMCKLGPTGEKMK
jgi:hypothetical protein